MSDDLKYRFGQRVRQLRLERGPSQETLAERCGLDRTYISSIERGRRNVSLVNIAILAKVFDLSIAQMFEDVDE
jgi:transcriptional regulator with XRE-family HTH domain